MHVLLGSLLCFIAIVPAAHGYLVEGDRWPGPTIAVWNGTGYTVPVADAMLSWNAVGANIKFVPAKSRTTADVVVRVGAPGQEGLAIVGYEPGNNITLSPRLGRIAAAALTAHELGLALGHETRGCTVMAPVVAACSLSKHGLGACKAL